MEPELAAAGAKKCLQNARALVDEARLLLEHHHFTRACSLAILAMEEWGKVYLIGQSLGDVEVVERFSDLFTKHDHKLIRAKLDILCMLQQKRGDSVMADADRFLKIDFNWYKKAGFYVAYEGGRFVSPEENIDEQYAAGIVGLTTELVEYVEGLAKQSDMVQVFAKLSDPKELEQIVGNHFNVTIRDVLNKNNTGQAN